MGLSPGLIALVGIPIWRMQSLDGLPDVGDPFDVAEARRPIDLADADNAFAAYAKASQSLANSRNNPIDVHRSILLCGAVLARDIKALTWSSSSPDIRAYLKAKRAALEIWREGSHRRDALYYQPNRIRLSLNIDLAGDTRILAGMAALEGSRLEEAGDLDGAWDWYHSMLRCSRLVGRHGFLSQRSIGEHIHYLASRCILRWASNPHVGAGQLRRALRDTLDADALTQPVTEALKINYLSCLKPFESMKDYEQMIREFSRPPPLLGGRQHGLVDHLPWNLRSPAYRLKRNATNELEKGRRVFRLLFANWLAQVDRPDARRAPLAIRKPNWIYVNDPSAPWAARAVTPEFLAQTFDKLELSYILFSLRCDDPGVPPWEREGKLTQERRRRSVLIIWLAAELFRREHGTLPAKAGALLGVDLKELPEGIAADDPIPEGLE